MSMITYNRGTYAYRAIEAMVVSEGEIYTAFLVQTYVIIQHLYSSYEMDKRYSLISDPAKLLP